MSWDIALFEATKVEKQNLAPQRYDICGGRKQQVYGSTEVNAPQYRWVNRIRRRQGSNRADALVRQRDENTDFDTSLARIPTWC